MNTPSCSTALPTTALLAVSCNAIAKDGAARSERRSHSDRAKYRPGFFRPADLKTLHGGRTPSMDKTEDRPDPRRRDAAHARIAAFQRQHLFAAP